MAEEIRRSRLDLAKTRPTPPPTRQPIGKRWLDRFKTRYPEIQGVWKRQVEGVRHNTANLEVIKAYFEATTEL